MPAGTVHPICMNPLTVILTCAVHERIHHCTVNDIASDPAWHVLVQHQTSATLEVEWFPVQRGLYLLAETTESCSGTQQAYPMGFVLAYEKVRQDSPISSLC